MRNLLLLVLFVFLYKQPTGIHAFLESDPLVFSLSAPAPVSVSSPLISPVSSSMAAVSPGANSLPVPMLLGFHYVCFQFYPWLV